MGEKVVKKPKKKLIIVIIIIAAVVALALIGYLRLQAMVGQVGIGVAPDVLVLSKTDLESKVTASGNFASTDPVSVGSNVTGGEVETVYVETGDRVVAGSVLAKLKTSDLERSISDAQYALSEASKGDRQRKEQAQRAVDDAEADWSASKNQTDDAVKRADSAYKAAKKLYDDAYALNPADPNLPDLKIASSKAKAELDGAKTQRDNTMRAAGSRVTEARAALDGLQGTDSARQQRSQLDTLNENLENASIVSPITGIVTRVTTEAGKVVMGDMFIIEDTESLQISATVAEYDIIKIEKGMPAHIKSNATGDEVYNGVVDFVAPKATDMSGNFEVKVLVTSGVGQLKPGMTATVEIVIESKTNVFAVPIDAVETRPDGKTVVYAYEPDSLDPNAQRREIEVKTGMETDYFIEIISDELNEGMLILADPMGLSVRMGNDLNMFGMRGEPGRPASGTATVTVIE